MTQQVLIHVVVLAAGRVKWNGASISYRWLRFYDSEDVWIPLIKLWKPRSDVILTEKKNK